MSERHDDAKPRWNWVMPAVQHVGRKPYLATVFPALAEHVNITIWTIVDDTGADLIEAYAPVRMWDADAWPELNGAAATLYHWAEGIPLEPRMVAAAWHHPGIFIVEDTVVAGLPLDRARGAIVHSRTAFAEVTARQCCSAMFVELPPAGEVDQGTAIRYAEDVLAAVERMMRLPTTIVAELAASVGRVLAASNMPPAAQAGVARRAAEELCKWLTPPE